MAKVRKIHSKPLFASSVPVARPQSGSTPGCLRVAAYARVSTDAEEQKNSFDAQKDYYKKLIEKTDGWIFSGIYADYGITGTSAEQLVSDDGDLLIAITAIRFFPDDHIEAEMEDGSTIEMELMSCWPDKRPRRKHSRP